LKGAGGAVANSQFQKLNIPLNITSKKIPSPHAKRTCCGKKVVETDWGREFDKLVFSWQKYQRSLLPVQRTFSQRTVGRNRRKDAWNCVGRDCDNFLVEQKGAILVPTCLVGRMEF
jgi:hypothetical protein